jgi:hypothetical protein
MKRNDDRYLAGEALCAALCTGLCVALVYALVSSALLA